MIIYGQGARNKLKVGVDKLAEAVSTTLGPKGGNVAIDGDFSTQVVHDGITVAKEVKLTDKFENMGARIVREASSKTNDIAGDGTTTSVILAQAIIEEGIKSISNGTNGMMLRKGLESASGVVVGEIKKLSSKIDTLEEKTQIATISSQSPVVGKMVAEAMEKVGKHGVITVEESRGSDLELEYKEGMRFNKGYLSPYFVTDQDRGEAVIESPLVLVTDIKMTSLQDLVPMLDKMIDVSKNLVIISSEIEGDALTSLVMNKLRGVLNILAIGAPGFGNIRRDMLVDIATITEATFISDESGRKLESVTIEDLGKADKIISTKSDTTIIGGNGDVSSRVKQINAQLKVVSDYEKLKLSERLAKLSGGVAVIKVGANTEAELKELKLRVEDAVHATKAAMEEGVIAGGGTTFLKAREAIKEMKVEGDELIGANILYKALEKPIRLLIRNSGEDEGIILARLYREWEENKRIGFNVITSEFVDMVKEGIIDPAKVARSALENAVSSSVMILSIGCLIMEEDDAKESTEENRS